MDVLEVAAAIVDVAGGDGFSRVVATHRAAFEARTGGFAPEDPWFEERIRAFWSDAVTQGRLGRQVEARLAPEARAWLGPLERAHRGLFRFEHDVLIDVWSGAELEVHVVEDASRAELAASAGQLFDARVVGHDDPFTVVLLTGAVFHPRDATACIVPVLDAARAQGLTTGDTLDALLRMHRALRALSRVKVAYAYRPEALLPSAPVLPHPPQVRRGAKEPT
jgi:hypothetical protein